MGIAIRWSYELADGKKGKIQSLPIDGILAEKKKLSASDESIAFTSFILHSALMRQARKENREMHPWEHWREHDLVDFDIVNEEDWEGGHDPFTEVESAELPTPIPMGSAP